MSNCGKKIIFYHISFFVHTLLCSMFPLSLSFYRFLTFIPFFSFLVSDSITWYFHNIPSVRGFFPLFFSYKQKTKEPERNIFLGYSGLYIRNLRLRCLFFSSFLSLFCVRFWQTHTKRTNSFWTNRKWYTTTKKQPRRRNVLNPNACVARRKGVCVYLFNDCVVHLYRWCWHHNGVYRM